MKIQILSIDGKKVKETNATIFDKPIREDIAQKVFEIEKTIQPYSNFPEAGKQHSASGRIRHRRHKWRSSYGRGISRVPRKIFWRRGTQFYWIGAEVSGTRGGRRAHPPKIDHFVKIKKINKKEILKAFESGIAATSEVDFIKKRYERINKKDKLELNLPFVVESSILKLKTKEFFASLRKILKDNFGLALKNRKIRAGRGKLRGRKYKENAGLLFVIGKDENLKIKGVEVVKTNQLVMRAFFPLGRLTIYTEKALNELEKLGKKELAKKEKEREKLKGKIKKKIDKRKKKREKRIIKNKTKEKKK